MFAYYYHFKFIYLFLFMLTRDGALILNFLLFILNLGSRTSRFSRRSHSTSRSDIRREKYRSIAT